MNPIYLMIRELEKDEALENELTCIMNSRRYELTVHANTNIISILVGEEK